MITTLDLLICIAAFALGWFFIDIKKLIKKKTKVVLPIADVKKSIVTFARAQNNRLLPFMELYKNERHLYECICEFVNLPNALEIKLSELYTIADVKKEFEAYADVIIGSSLVIGPLLIITKNDIATANKIADELIAIIDALRKASDTLENT